MKLSRSLNTKLLKEITCKVYLPTIVCLLIIVVIVYYNDLGLAVMTKDPAVIATSLEIVPFIDPVHNPLMGIVSQIGILFWCITASLCLFSVLILSQKPEKEIKQINFLKFFGLVTSLLLLDDLLMLHESIFPSLFNIPEEATYFSYCLICLWGFNKFYKSIIHSDWSILLLSLIWFFGSIMIDTVPFINNSISYSFFLEDGLKLLGITSWFYYFFRVCVRSFQNQNSLEISYNYRENSSYYDCVVSRSSKDNSKTIDL